MLALFLTGLLGLVVPLSQGSPGHVDLTPLAWAEGTADCLTDRFGQMGQLVRPAWVEERGVCEVEVHVPARTTFEGPMPAETFVDPITTERVVLVWTTDTGDEATTWFDLIWRETGPEPVGVQAEAEGTPVPSSSRWARTARRGHSGLSGEWTARKQAGAVRARSRDVWRLRDDEYGRPYR